MAQRVGKAVVLKSKGQVPDISVEEVPIPEPGPGEVLVKIDSSPINPSDLGLISGLYLPEKPVPLTPGLEGSGTVVAAGSDEASQALIGKRVTCVVKLATNYGCWAEFLLTTTPHVYVINDDVTFEEASTFHINPFTVLLYLELIQEGGHKAVIQNAAASALGKMLIKSLQRLNIPSINIVRRQEQVEALRAIGAEHVLDSSQEGFTQRLSELSRELNATIAFDAVAGEATGVLLTAIQPNGTVYVTGALSGNPSSGINSVDLRAKNKTLLGAWLLPWLRKLSPEKNLAIRTKVHEHIKTDFSTEISARFPLESIAEALAYAKANTSAGKTLLKLS